MSKYTTEVRFICEEANGLQESKGYSHVEEIIAGAIPKIFDFDFPIFDENYRSVLETKILKHFYTREIGEETVGLWKLRLNTKLNEIMPYYNKLYSSELLAFNPLYTTNITRTRKTDYDSNRDTTNETVSEGTNETTMTTTTEGSGTGTGTSTNGSTDLYSDTPQGAITGLNENTYLTQARKVSDSGSTTSSSTNSSESTANSNGTSGGTSNSSGNDKLKSTEEWLESVIGFEGRDASELLMKFRKTFLNIDMEVLRDLEPLFIQLW